MSEEESEEDDKSGSLPPPTPWRQASGIPGTDLAAGAGQKLERGLTYVQQGGAKHSCKNR